MVGGAVEACHLHHHQEWSLEESPLHQTEEVMEAMVAMEVMVIMVDMEVTEVMGDIGICLHLDTTCHHHLVRRHQDNGVVDMASPLPHPGHQVLLDPQDLLVQIAAEINGQVGLLHLRKVERVDLDLFLHPQEHSHPRLLECHLLCPHLGHLHQVGNHQVTAEVRLGYYRI